MKTRLLAYFHEIRTPEAVRGENGKLIGFTKPFTDRGGQCCLEVTREQWAELQLHRWASPVLEVGFLIPDVDFVAKDGRVFQDAAECVAHERTLDFPAWKRAIEDKRHGVPADLCGNNERAGFLEIDMVEIGAEETLLGIITAFEHLIAYELRDFDTQLVLFGTHPSFEFVRVTPVEEVDFYALPKYEVRDGEIKSQCGQVVKSAGSYPVALGANPSTATILDDSATAAETRKALHERIQALPEQSLEARVLSALAAGQQRAAPLAESLGVTVDEIKEAAKVSEFLMWRGPYLALKPLTVQ